MNIIQESWVFLVTVLVLSISVGLLLMNFNRTNLFEGYRGGRGNDGWTMPVSTFSNDSFNYITPPVGTNAFQYFNGDLGNKGGDSNEQESYDLKRGLMNDISTPSNQINIVNNDRNNMSMQQNMQQDGVFNHKDNNVASFNYDLLYNSGNLTPKYSFMNSSFLYKSELTDETDYLNEIYFNKNPLEMERMCKKLDNTTCGLTSSCVYVGHNKCVPGGKHGPYTTYSDINVDFYYYRGKCFGNCPGQFGVSGDNGSVGTTSVPVSSTSVPMSSTSVPLSSTSVKTA